MNVLFIGLYPPHIGGIATHTFHLRQRLEERGHEVHVVTYAHEGAPPDDRVHMVDTSARFRGISFIRKAPSVASSVIEEHGIDIIHSHFVAPPGYVGNGLAKKHGIPHVTTAHGSDINFMSKELVGKFLISRTLKHADAVICVSKDLKRRVEERTKAPVHYIPNGVDMTQFYPSDEQKEYILYVGALTEQKRVDEIIDALEGTGERLVVAGDGPERPRLMWLARQRNVDAEFLGYTTDVPSLMRRAKLLVQPSKEEGFGLTVLEAMASGVPTIARKRPALEEIVEHEVNGLLFPCFKVFRRELEALRSDESLRADIAREGLETAKKFSWKCVAERTEEVYKTLSRKD